MALDTGTFKTKCDSGVTPKVIRQQNHNNFSPNRLKEPKLEEGEGCLFHGTADTYFPSAGQSAPFCPCSSLQDREFLPEGHLLLGELHVIADEEALRVLPLAVGHDAAVELGDGWQPAGTHQEPQSARREAQTGSPTRQSHQSASALTP